ncbi:hypothetical protein [Lentibacter sp. XHP0401]|uniref:hypothetical protein n=1 Tax=Lentibacter sp. XHP0401 TaxID=2984334 RepID=UPI0021E780DF|nr:hypothetical protein [Lentibacter sp. XHP0401]MCV2893436.1 hypothetical protein [Lentibacter sp. XHP0401]
MSKTTLQMCYDFHTIDGQPFNKEIVITMAKALDVTVILPTEKIEAEEYWGATGHFVELYDVAGFDLKMAIGFNQNTLRACGRLLTPYQVKDAGITHDIHVNGEYFDMMNFEYRYGELLGVFPSPRYGDRSKDH